MKASNGFKEVIEKYLKERASNDEDFSKVFNNKKKNIDDCITYILNTVQKSGLNGFEDDEIYSMAVHYYYEENIEVGSKISGKVIVNHKIELTPEEIEAEKEKARQSVFQAQVDKMTKREKPKKSNKTQLDKNIFSAAVNLNKEKKEPVLKLF